MDESGDLGFDFKKNKNKPVFCYGVSIVGN